MPTINSISDDGKTIYFSTPTGEQSSSAVGGVPIVQGFLQSINTSTNEMVQQTATVTSLYSVSTHIESSGQGAAGSYLICTLKWTSPTAPHTETLSIPLDTATVSVETFPIFVIEGAVISFATQFQGAPSPYDISIRIVLMPAIGGAQ